ncbi:SigE family RNA polymerase sigma factor [Streptacidiphilus sp. P02-A3a]|uniref:SigE family RNA polymerase sigma factor n=1 Tax=Streptacidiphilus sp. P02-A3a TaxID=2704468 RepID=UPI0015FA3F8F|nr:SigE family RNA polymerase sigma factor [Streptacidiphilus sp. P02-A3a]QMU68057.1 SigE family RNA polymerase sigma factor [Streptacidiphilus sp. P02-A3a]
MAKPSRHDREFTEYVHARRVWLRQLAYLLCQDWHRADDLAQATLLKLYLHWGRAKKAVHLDAYVRTILVRTFLNEQKTTWWARISLKEADIEPVTSLGFDESSLDLTEALAQVPARQRAALVLRFYCDLSVEQTAEALNCSPGTVKSQTARGLDRLRATVASQPAIQD